MNGIDLVRADRQRVNELFVRFNADLDRTLVKQAIEALRAHKDAEHAALYAFAARVLDAPALMELLRAAHEAVQKQIDVVAGLEDNRLVDAFQTLQAFVGENARVEETKLFPRLTELATAEQLEGLALQILSVKQGIR